MSDLRHGHVQDSRRQGQFTTFNALNARGSFDTIDASCQYCAPGCARQTHAGDLT